MMPLCNDSSNESLIQAQKALKKREALSQHLGPHGALRLLNATADGVPGVWIDSFAGHWVVATQEPSFPRWVVELPGWHSLYWKQLSDQTKQAPQWIRGEKLESPLWVEEGGVRFSVDPIAGYSPGLFLDQRDNRKWLKEWVVENGSRQEQALKILNTFAYTCSFSVAAAVAGAKTTSVDLSATYLDWGRRNFEGNHLSIEGHEFLKGDVFDWLKRLGRKRRLFDAIILDPPTFSRSKVSGVFRVGKDYATLLDLALPLLRRRGVMLLCANQRSLETKTFEATVRDTLRGHGSGKLEEHLMPSDFSGDPYLKSFALINWQPSS